MAGVLDLDKIASGIESLHNFSHALLNSLMVVLVVVLGEESKGDLACSNLLRISISLNAKPVNLGIHKEIYDGWLHVLTISCDLDL